MSPESRAKIAAAQKIRWAKINEKSSAKKSTPAKATAAVKDAPKKKVMSSETKAKLAASMKARWATKKKSTAVPAGAAK